MSSTLIQMCPEQDHYYAAFINCLWQQPTFIVSSWTSLHSTSVQFSSVRSGMVWSNLVIHTYVYLEDIDKKRQNGRAQKMKETLCGDVLTFAWKDNNFLQMIPTLLTIWDLVYVRTCYMLAMVMATTPYVHNHHHVYWSVYVYIKDVRPKSSCDATSLRI